MLKFIFKNTDSKTYNIPIQHVPSSKSNNNLNDEILNNSINELLALKDSNLDAFKKNSNYIFFLNTCINLII